jgi:TRAP-type uncharacterized transport system substrate-binding protein
MLIKLPKRNYILMICIAVIAVLALTFWLLSRSISPAPPGRIDMTTGAIDGAYHQFALKYQRYLATHGVTLNLLPSTGAVENLDRLHAGTPAGMVQGGLGNPALDSPPAGTESPLRSLGVVAYEPVWLFAPGPLAAELAKGLAPLAGKKVAIGAEGSGTRKVALDLLQGYGLSAGSAALSSEGGLAAAKELMAGKLDAVFILGAPQSPAIQLLLGQPGLVLVGIEHAEGLTRRLPYLSLVTLKAGSVDPARDQPPADITLLTTTANLVVRDDLHPALAYLLLEAASDIHRGATLLNRPGEFPHPRATEFPLADEAERYYKEGRPFLQRYMPYWAANALQRLILVLVPLLAVAVPVIKAVPMLFNFREEQRLYRLYGELLDIERTLLADSRDSAETTAAVARLDAVSREVGSAKFSLDFADRVYTLRQHIDYVKERLPGERAGDEPAGAGAG